MSEDLTIKLLLSMDSKLDGLKDDMGSVVTRVTVIEEKTDNLASMESRLASVESKIFPLWAAAASIGAALVAGMASFVAYLTGFFKGEA